MELIVLPARLKSHHPPDGLRQRRETGAKSASQILRSRKSSRRNSADDGHGPLSLNGMSGDCVSVAPLRPACFFERVPAQGSFRAKSSLGKLGSNRVRPKNLLYVRIDPQTQVFGWGSCERWVSKTDEQIAANIHRMTDQIKAKKLFWVVTPV